LQLGLPFVNPFLLNYVLVLFFIAHLPGGDFAARNAARLIGE
jgi:hypothetical protein